MNIDFSLVLLVLVVFCGFLWALDSLVIKKSRAEAVDKFRRSGRKGKSEEEIDRVVADLSQEPLIIEYAKSFFSGITDCFPVAFVSSLTVSDSDRFNDPDAGGR